jgi:hypothetical protein
MSKAFILFIYLFKYTLLLCVCINNPIIHYFICTRDGLKYLLKPGGQKHNERFKFSSMNKISCNVCEDNLLYCKSYLDLQCSGCRNHTISAMIIKHLSSGRGCFSRSVCLGVVSLNALKGRLLLKAEIHLHCR